MTLDEGGWRRPEVRLVTPPSALRDVVELFWLDEWNDETTTAHSFRIVADDAPHILWYLTGDRALRTQRLSVAGAREWHHDANLQGRRVMVGARLVPGVIPLLFDVPAFALTNRSVPLTSIASTSIRIPHCTTRDSLVGELCGLIAGMRGSRVGDSRAVWIARQRRAGPTTVGSFAQTFGMPPRSLRAWSARTLGMGLKRLLKIRRLHAALERRLAGPDATWSQIAAVTGYADQSHLIRDCRALLGESPSEFMARSSSSELGERRACS